MLLHDNVAIVASLQFGISGPADCHVYAVRSVKGTILIDAGGGTHTGALLANLARDFGCADIDSVILTHSHPDHCAGAADLRRMTGARVLTSSLSRAAIETGDEIATGLRSARDAGVYARDFRLTPCPVDGVFSDGDSFQAAGLTFTALHVRGHSPDSFCLLTQIGGTRFLFSGDVVFYGGVLGVINSEGSDMAGYRADLCKLAGLDIDALAPGHGLFTLANGQKHIDCAIEQLGRNFLCRQIGQGDAIF